MLQHKDRSLKVTKTVNLQSEYMCQPFNSICHTGKAKLTRKLAKVHITRAGKLEMTCAS